MPIFVALTQERSLGAGSTKTREEGKEKEEEEKEDGKKQEQPCFIFPSGF